MNRSASSFRGVTRRLLTPVGRRSGSGRIDIWILGAFLAIAILLGGFAMMGSEMAEGETLAFDRQILLSLRHANDLGSPVGPRWAVSAMVDLTSLGGVAVLTLVTFIAFGFLMSSRKPALALFVLGSVGGGALVGTLLKSLFLRARPEVVPHLVQVDSASFPSGHALNSAVVYLTLAALLARSMVEWRLRAYLLLVAMVLVVLIGVTRVYVGVHYPTDVLAGWTIGAAWAILCSLVAQGLQRHSAVEPEQSRADLQRGGDGNGPDRGKRDPSARS